MNLHMKSKVLTLHGKMEVLDDQEQIVYTVESKAVSIHNKTYLKNAQGAEVAYISRKPLSLHELHTVEMASGEKFQLNTELFHIKDVINIEALGWTLRGDFMQHNYVVEDSAGRTLASTHMKWFSIHYIFYIDIEDEAHTDMLVALFVTLERIVQDRVNASTATGAAISSSDSGQ